MATVLIAWELGGGLNHLARAAALAREFTDQGERVFVVLRSLQNSQLFAWPDGARLLQAPIAGVTRPLPDPCNYAEILFSCGYHDATTLAGMVIGWSSLIDLIQPDVVVADHAPTASLVARLADIPLARMGSGFFAPPAVSPFPVFRTWAAVDGERLKAVESQVLGAINGVAQSCAVVFDHVAQALHPDLDLITCWPELDHYAGMRPEGSAEFVGPERMTTPGPPLQWPRQGSRRVLAYLNAGYPGFERVVRGLKQADVATVAFLLDAEPEKMLGLEAGNFSVRQQLFDPWDALRACDALVCHAGNGTVATALEAGKPVLMLPYTTEQFIYAGRVQQAGAGLRLDEAQVASDFDGCLEQFLSSAGYGLSAQALAETQGSQGDAIGQAVEKIRALLRRS